MLKVKKQIHKKIINNDQNEKIKNQNELKDSIKNLYIGNQKKENHRRICGINYTN